MEEEPRKRSRIDYDTITPEEARSLIARLEKNYTTNSIGCKLFGGSLNTDGYAQIQLKGAGPGGKKRNLLAHIVAVRSTGRKAPSPGEHGSHICNMRNCFHPEHVTVESVFLNNQRKGCPGDIRCDCGKLAYACPHDPKCIRC